MKVKYERKEYSFRKKSRGYILCLTVVAELLFLLLAMIFFKYNANSISEINKGILNNSCQTVENNLTDANNYVANIFANNNNWDLMVRTQGNDFAAYKEEMSILNLLKMRTTMENEKCAYFVFKNMENGFYTTYPADYNTTKITEMNEILKKELLENSEILNGQWILLDSENDYIFAVIYKNGNNYIGTFLDMEQYADQIGTHSNQIIFKWGKKIMCRGENTASLKTTLHKYVTEQSCDRIPLKIYSVMPQTRLKKLILEVAVLELVFIVAMYVAFRWIFRLFEHVIIYPVEQMSHIEQQILQKKSWETGKITTNITELKAINESLESLISNILKLEKETYEKEMNYQRARLQYFQLQTEPHFFLNCLKNIYALAESQKYQVIQYMIKSISEHFRYIFRGNFEDVSIEEELEETDCYFRLCQLSSGNPMLLEMQADKTLLKKKIPILIIQSFVENSIKYAKKDDKILKIEVNVQRADENNIRISISDNGKGYPDKILQDITNRTRHSDDKGSHIGIFNVVDRLDIIYAKQTKICIFNNEEGGACTEIIIPEDRKL